MRQYYAYIFKDPDGTPFYVGKGYGRRIRYLRGRNKQVLGHIRNLEDAGLKYLVQKIDVKSEEEAFAIEKNLITKYGRKDTGSGCLLNHTDGGEGMSGYIWTEEQRIKLRGNQRGKGRRLRGPGALGPQSTDHVAKRCAKVSCIRCRHVHIVQNLSKHLRVCA